VTARNIEGAVGGKRDKYEGIVEKYMKKVIRVRIDTLYLRGGGEKESFPRRLPGFAHLLI
jgi:hypothetical protein